MRFMNWCEPASIPRSTADDAVFGTGISHVAASIGPIPCLKFSASIHAKSFCHSARSTVSFIQTMGVSTRLLHNLRKVVTAQSTAHFACNTHVETGFGYGRERRLCVKVLTAVRISLALQ